MAVVRPFRAIRPTSELASKVAALPYDVMNSEEARQMVVGNPYSFLHVDKAEIDLDPSIDHYDKKVYQKARENLDKMSADGVYIQDEKPCFYLYKQVMDGRSQVGIVGCASIDDYMNNVIKKHELTRADKEEDRVNHVDYCNANTGPIFLTYKARTAINAIVEKTMAAAPVYDFTADGVQNTVWVITDEADIKTIGAEFDAAGNLYIADGHHRCASAARVGKMRREQNPGYTGQEEFNYFLAVIFPDEQLHIMDYNRVVKDLNGMSDEQFMEKMKGLFHIKEYCGEGQYRPESKHTFGMYLNDKWYILTAHGDIYDPNDPVDQLDVSILQKNVLDPLLGIQDPRTDSRIDFIGGIRGLGELERRVKEGMKVAFAMYPTSIEELINIADAGKIMPPKSTWFEPKLMSGLFVHQL